ncbi:MAG: aminotransferase class V-fold PLP-dependent enzyme [Bacillota bacterium]
MNKIYLDHAATTYVKPAVMEEMAKYFTDVFGNASSMHSFGRDGAVGLSKARETIAKEIGALPSEIYFTAGGSESDNWALRGIAKRKGSGHIITSCIEHPAIKETAEDLQKQGFEVTFVGVSEDGYVDPAEVEKNIKENTILISIMSANNEVGTIQPFEEIAKIAKSRRIPFHTDAVQAMGAIKFNVKEMGIDMLSMSGHKFYGPKGIGVLYIRNGLGIGKFVTGGHQERGMRAGTSATPLIVGMAKALEIANANLEQENARLSNLRDYLATRIKNEVPYIRINGGMDKRLPNNLNISFEYIEGESILMLLDLAGIAVSTGSACSSGTLESSYVLLSMKVPVGTAHGSVRFTLGEKTTKEELDTTVEKVKEIVKKLREMSPLFSEKEGETQYV